MRTTRENVLALLQRAGYSVDPNDPAVAQALADAEHEVSQYTLELEGTATSVEDGKLVDKTADFLAARVFAGQNEVQSVSVTNATGGTFTLAFRGAATNALAHNASAAQIQAALEALPTIGTGNVRVLGSNPWEVTFQNALGKQDVPPLEPNGSGLSGQGATVTVAVTTEGAPSAYVLNRKTYERTTVQSDSRTKLTLDAHIFEELDPYSIEDVARIERAERYKAASLLVNMLSGVGRGISSAALGPFRLSFGSVSATSAANEFEAEFLKIVGPAAVVL